MRICLAGDSRVWIATIASEHRSFQLREPTGSLALNAPRQVARLGRDAKALGAAYSGAFLHLRSDRQLKGAFHPFARWPGSLHRAPHLGLRLPRFLRLVSNLVILSSCNASPVLPSASCGLLSHVILRFVALSPHRCGGQRKTPWRTRGFWARRLGIGDLAAESFHQ
jgi:hypothetical protein